MLPAFPSVVGEQLGLLLADIVPDVIKVGMLATDDVLLRVAPILERIEVPRVVDPVLRSSSSHVLLEPRAYGNLMSRIVNGAALVTPNLPEAESLTGYAQPEDAAKVFLECGAGAALVTGGHADGPPDDLLVTPEATIRIPGERVGEGPVHGTGCALSSAIAAHLARGLELESAVRRAKAWVQDAIARAVALGRGQKLLVFE